MAVDPEIALLLEQLANMPALETLSPGEARALIEAGREEVPPGPEIHSVENRTLLTAAGTLRVRIYRPVALSSGLIVYFHPGGWVIGSLDGSDATLRAFALRTGCCIVSVDYRLAPENRFPAAVVDAMNAVAWASNHCEELAGERVPVLLAGESAGGNLAAVAAILAREAGGPRIAGQLMLYPVTDANFDTPSYIQNAQGYFLTRPIMRWFWDHYLPEVGQRSDFRASPLRATDLSGLPPALIQVGEYDPLRDEGEAYGRRLAEAGTEVVVQRRVGLIHGFLGMSALSKAAAAAVNDAVEWVRSRL